MSDHFAIGSMNTPIMQTTEEQVTFQFEIWWFAVQKHNLDVDIFSVFVEKILKKVTDTFEGDVSANNYVPGITQLT